ncbi:hypothetical protein HMPREF1120_08865 [Exophiala dermatitidis NIH/UT8656]|uniref:Uncharacterized protein n=1 Tax=Exophiala dermatitidis (strain ATCC 34100 / CBS 525.76 / NIH/UT8656) TaxID=858893 RepID=H6CAX5_EXODN|nr:hypothetical protein HMPREF1120_08865 [Exophiala dermatitidis NIH/UT8656]
MAKGHYYLFAYMNTELLVHGRTGQSDAFMLRETGTRGSRAAKTYFLCLHTVRNAYVHNSLPQSAIGFERTALPVRSVALKLNAGQLVAMWVTNCESSLSIVFARSYVFGPPRGQRGDSL